jgi:hypothetical protein
MHIILPMFDLGHHFTLFVLQAVNTNLTMEIESLSEQVKRSLEACNCLERDKEQLQANLAGLRDELALQQANLEACFVHLPIWFSTLACCKCADVYAFQSCSLNPHGNMSVTRVFNKCAFALVDLLFPSVLSVSDAICKWLLQMPVHIFHYLLIMPKHFF